jgi:hypothetical protein
MKKSRLYITTSNYRKIDKCNHKTKEGSEYWLSTDYSKKYNHCMFCAIESWNGSMPHDEIAMCLGISRMSVCNVEKKVMLKLTKRIGKSCSEVAYSRVHVKGIKSNIEKLCIEKISEDISNELGLECDTNLIITSREISLSETKARAIYLKQSDRHKIIVNANCSKKEFIRTLIHEFVHALQYEKNQVPDENIATIASNEFLNKFYRRFQKSSKVIKKNHLIGKRP